MTIPGQSTLKQDEVVHYRRFVDILKARLLVIHPLDNVITN
jgi:hypothetical protein